MGLKCKIGAYNRVLKELLDLNIPRGDIFLLFGEIDMLVQFIGLKSVDEFVQKWFNPIRKIGAEKALITQTLTFIVISEGPLFAEEPFAFIFLKAQPRNLENVRSSLLTIPEVISADTVFGSYDVICPIRANNKKDLERVISHIHNRISGVEGTITSMIAGLRV
jgi:DNA-binding Lrp family transcriptional regulator